MFARTAVRAVTRTTGAARRQFAHATFEPENYSKALIGSIIAGVVISGLGATKFAVTWQMKKSGMDKNPVGYSP